MYRFPLRRSKLSDKLVPDKLGRHGHVTIGAGRDFPQFPTVQIHNTEIETDKLITTPISINLCMPLAHAITRQKLLDSLSDFYPSMPVLASPSPLALEAWRGLLAPVMSATPVFDRDPDLSRLSPPIRRVPGGLRVSKCVLQYLPIVPAGCVRVRKRPVGI